MLFLSGTESPPVLHILLETSTVCPIKQSLITFIHVIFVTVTIFSELGFQKKENTKTKTELQVLLLLAPQASLSDCSHLVSTHSGRSIAQVGPPPH